MSNDSRTTIGVDVGDRRSHFCVLDEAGEVVERGDFRTTPTGLKRMLGGRGDDTTRIAFETGSHALWIRRQVEAAGCEAIEANPRSAHAWSGLGAVLVDQSRQLSARSPLLPNPSTPPIQRIAHL